MTPIGLRAQDTDHYLSLDPLYHAIEPDALDAFVDQDGRDSACWLTFSYEGCRVYVGEDTVRVANLELGVAE
jgi:hypothetical protein